MEPVTINLPDFSALAEQFGPQGYALGYFAAAMFFGVVAWRSIGAAGGCHGAACSNTNDAPSREEKQQAVMGSSHVARAIISGVLGLINMIVAIDMSVELFTRAIDKTSPTTLTAYQSTVSGMSTLCSPYVITSGDGYSFTIYTSNPLSDHDLRSLKILGAETTRLDRVDALSEFLNRCKSRGIRVTTIVAGLVDGFKTIYDNPKNKEVGEITQIPCIVWGGESERVVTAAESGGVVATSYVSGAKEK